MGNPSIPSQRAQVPWSQLRKDLFLLAVATVVPLLAVVVDMSRGCHEWFSRSGAVSVAIGLWLGSRSLTKHNWKSFKNTQRGYALWTSRNQAIVDVTTLIVAAAGTLIWGFGDMLFQRVCQ